MPVSEFLAMLHNNYTTTIVFTVNNFCLFIRIQKIIRLMFVSTEENILRNKNQRAENCTKKCIPETCTGKKQLA